MHPTLSEFARERIIRILEDEDDPTQWVSGITIRTCLNRDPDLNFTLAEVHELLGELVRARRIQSDLTFGKFRLVRGTRRRWSRRPASRRRT